MATTLPGSAATGRRPAPAPLDPVRVTTWALAIAVCVAFWSLVAWTVTLLA